MSTTKQSPSKKTEARATSQGVNRHLGHQIRDLRRAKGVTIPQLAARIERSVGWLSQIERGLSEVSIAALHQIAQALEVQVSWFFGQGATPPVFVEGCNGYWHGQAGMLRVEEVGLC